MRTNKYLAILVGLLLLGTPSKAQDDMKIGKQNIKLTSNLMTPEALWAMGRIGGCEASAKDCLPLRGTNLDNESRWL